MKSLMKGIIVRHGGAAVGCCCFTTRRSWLWFWPAGFSARSPASSVQKHAVRWFGSFSNISLWLCVWVGTHVCVCVPVMNWLSRKKQVLACYTALSKVIWLPYLSVIWICYGVRFRNHRQCETLALSDLMSKTSLGRAQAVGQESRSAKVSNWSREE